MQFISLAVLKRYGVRCVDESHDRLHAIHTACGIETFESNNNLIRVTMIACNSYRLRYFFYFSVRFFQTAAFFMA